MLQSMQQSSLRFIRRIRWTLAEIVQCFYSHGFTRLINLIHHAPLPDRRTIALRPALPGAHLGVEASLCRFLSGAGPAGADGIGAGCDGAAANAGVAAGRPYGREAGDGCAR